MLGRLSVWKRIRLYSTGLVKTSTRGKVALLELNRPEALNSLNSQFIEELIISLRRIEVDESLAAAVITGNNKSFAGTSIHSC